MSETGIVIRTYNEAEYLAQTLDVVMAQTEQSFEIVLVDSGSTDDTIDIARRYSRVQVIEIQKHEFTYGRALNIGINSVSRKVSYVAMLSAHAIPCNQFWLENLLLPLRSNPEIAGVYGKQVPLPEHLCNKIVRMLAEDGYKSCYGDTFFVSKTSPFFSNANCAIRLNGWHECKFDENLPYAEDWCWAIGMLSLGYSLAYQPESAVFHSHPDSYRQFFRRRRNEEAAMSSILPDQFPTIRRQDLFRKLTRFALTYAKKSIEQKNVFGAHSDSFFYHVTSNLAAYYGRG